MGKSIRFAAAAAASRRRKRGPHDPEPVVRRPVVLRGEARLPRGRRALRAAPGVLARRGGQRGLPRRHVLPPRRRPRGGARGGRACALPLPRPALRRRRARGGHPRERPRGGGARELPRATLARGGRVRLHLGVLRQACRRARRPADVRGVPRRFPLRGALRGVGRALLARHREPARRDPPAVRASEHHRARPQDARERPGDGVGRRDAHVLREERARLRPDAPDSR